MTEAETKQAEPRTVDPSGWPLSVYLPRETHEAIWRAINKAGMSRSAWVQRAIRAALDKET